MEPKLKKKTFEIFLQAAKIAIGSSLAIFIATAMNLEFGTSAGIITLLTIVTTKLETLRLSFFRIITFIITVLFSWVIFWHLSNKGIAYGLFVFFIVFIMDWIGWKAVISVNAVIGTHFLVTHDFSFSFIKNELLLVVIGISLAIILNLFINNGSLKKKITHNIRYTEERLQLILDELARYLSCEQMERDVWKDTVELENHLQYFTKQAYEYCDNTFRASADYYIHYFEMRTQQCNLLHNLHYEMKKIRQMPKQAHIISEYILYLKGFVLELNDPKKQIDRLNELFEDIKNEELPDTWEEFEGRAKLYHILMDLEEFLTFKRRFVDAEKDDKNFPHKKY